MKSDKPTPTPWRFIVLIGLLGLTWYAGVGPATCRAYGGPVSVEVVAVTMSRQLHAQRHSWQLGDQFFEVLGRKGSKRLGHHQPVIPVATAALATASSLGASTIATPSYWPRVESP